ncbi:MAG: phage protein Gp37 [Pseudomonadota bacterium]
MIAQIELAMLARLRAAEERLGYRWAMLETYPVDWDEYFKSKGALRSPAAWVTFAGVTGVEGASFDLRARTSFGVAVCARNLRNETATRHGYDGGEGGASEPGSYQLMLDAAGLLIGDDLGLDIDRLKLAEIGQVEGSKIAALRQASMWALHFTTTIPIAKLTTVDGRLADFATFHANWDLPPRAIDAGDLPADALADATDHVELPQ